MENSSCGGDSFAGNGATTAAPGEPGDWDAAVIKAELKKLPRNYQPEKAVEDDPIIMHVDYRDGVFHALYDVSRDHFGGFGSDPVEYTLPHPAVFDETDKQVAYLVEEDGLSLADITAKINQNQDPNGPGDLVMLYQYGKS